MNQENTQPATSVEFVKHRWYVRIVITLPDGSVREFVASADDAFTEGSGIWFGTGEEFTEEWERL